MRTLIALSFSLARSALAAHAMDEASEFLIKQRNIGIDTASIDHGPLGEFAARETIGAANVPIFEKVTALDRLPSKGSTTFAIL
jgi:kynurenine formamidase